MKKRPKLLLIEDDPRVIDSLTDILDSEGFEVTTANMAKKGIEAIKKEDFDVILSDYKLPDFTGLEIITTVQATKPMLPIILMTAHSSTDITIEATKRGAYDYVTKPFDIDELIKLLKKAAQQRQSTEDQSGAPSPILAQLSLLGQSKPMQELYKQLGRVAVTDTPVLIQGETGTGKELIARALLQYSKRSDKNFVAINCAAIPENLLESELFGYEKGAFTGADSRRIGKFEQADGGTLFLDEIGDMNLNCQAKILRVLQEQKIQRLGGHETIPVNVRIVAATHRNLSQLVAEKKFREDLFYRLSVVVLHSPSLRDRKTDIPLLVNHFLAQYSHELKLPLPSLQKEALDFLCQQEWMGNVRQLENVMRRVLINTRGYSIQKTDIDSVYTSQTTATLTNHGDFIQQWVREELKTALALEKSDVLDSLQQQITREACLQAFALAHENLSQAARILGISRLTLREKLNQFRIKTEE